MVFRPGLRVVDTIFPTKKGTIIAESTGVNYVVRWDDGVVYTVWHGGVFGFVKPELYYPPTWDCDAGCARVFLGLYKLVMPCACGHRRMVHCGKGFLGAPGNYDRLSAYVSGRPCPRCNVEPRPHGALPCFDPDVALGDRCSNEGEELR
jgi:hypothetical protein